MRRRRDALNEPNNKTNDKQRTTKITNKNELEKTNNEQSASNITSAVVKIKKLEQKQLQTAAKIKRRNPKTYQDNPHAMRSSRPQANS